jgi:hypothetical protein
MDLQFCSINKFLSAEFQTFPSYVEMNYREGLSLFLRHARLTVENIVFLSIYVRHAYVSKHMKTKTDQYATHNTLTSVPTLPR